MIRRLLCAIVPLFLAAHASADPLLSCNQVAFDTHAPKQAILRADAALPADTTFSVIDTQTSRPALTLPVGSPLSLEEWAPGKLFYKLDFSSLDAPGKYKLQITVSGTPLATPEFLIDDHALARTLVPSLLDYFKKSRAAGKEMWAADEHIPLIGSESKTVDLRGGWCDASGDISKYFSHLAYANFMSPQQSPLTTWVLADTAQRVPAFLDSIHQKQNAVDESLWGADYMLRSLSPDGYFYMVVFGDGDFGPDLSKRRVCALLPNSKRTADYQCAFREGGGMAIAGLARASTLHQNGAFTSQQYLDGARRAFDHLLANNLKYCDDGRENIIDDYCALLAATELWIATDDPAYRDHARRRVANLKNRLSPDGYFIANDKDRPFWHAADAGLPVVALARYLEKETDPAARLNARDAIRKNLDYQLAVTAKVPNPFGYARQSFLFKNQLREGFFIPHENESGWWWQGENARLASLASAAFCGQRALDSFPTHEIADHAALPAFAHSQLAWVLGNNPYNLCFVYGFGSKNPTPEHSHYGQGPFKGGISNGITGGRKSPDGSGLDFLARGGDAWRGSEQWLPHATWFLHALAAAIEDPR